MSKLNDGGSDRERFDFTGREIQNMITCLKYVFDLVRLVDPNIGCELEINGAGTLVERPGKHYAPWHGEITRSTGMAMRALMEKTQLTKFEVADDDLYHLTARYVVADGRPCVLEMISRVSDTTMLDGMGKPEIADAISSHNARMYIDPVTGVYNRRYYEDHFLHMSALRAVTMIDVDDFKSINDTCGRAVGDQVLNSIASAVNACVRNTDAVIRFGGDEFVVIFNGLPEEVLPARMKGICDKVANIIIDGHPTLRTTVSIGGAYGQDSIRKLIERADREMRIMKENKNSARAAE